MPMHWLSLLLKPRGLITKTVLLLIIFTVLAINFISYLQPVKQFLNSGIMIVKLGSVSISMYMIVQSGITIMVLMWILSIFSEVGEKRIRSMRGVKPSNKALIVKAFQIVTYSLTFIIGLDVLGIDLKTLSMFSGALGIGLGFGLQKIASNFISGIILLFEKSIENDDLVELPDGTCGFVRYTRARYTLIETRDGKEIMVPNEDFISKQVTNLTYSNNAGRIEIPISLAYSNDIELACKLITDSAQEYPSCLNDPLPSCFLVEFAPSAVKVLLFFWVADISKGKYRPRSSVMMTILEKFKSHNIEIPLDQHEVRILNNNEKTTKLN